MENKLYDAFEICLEALEQGESMDACLARYPELADELRPMLYAAQRARAVAEMDVPKQALARGRARLLRHAAEMREAEVQPRRKRFSMPKLAYALMLLLIFTFSGTGLVNASSTAIPGDNLYTVKRSWEDFRLFFTFNGDAYDALEESFEDERYEEIHDLFEHGRTAHVSFVGLVAEQLPDAWMVSGLPIVLNSGTYVDANILVGDTVIVQGITQPDTLQVLATQIELAPAGTNLPAFESEDDDDDESTKYQVLPSPIVDPTSTDTSTLDADKADDFRSIDKSSSKNDDSSDDSSDSGDQSDDSSEDEVEVEDD